MNIVFLGAKPQMFRSNTRRVVAFVKHLKSFWYGSKVEIPRRNVCQYSTLKWGTSAYVSISINGSAIPNPARICLFNLLPKAILEVFGKPLRSQELGRKINFHRLVICAFGLQAQRASLLSPCKFQIQQ